MEWSQQGKLFPYARLDVVRIGLQPYSESGSAIWDLGYDQASSTTLSSTLGARATFAMAESWGVLTPSARFEYAHAFTGAFNQGVYYVSLPGTTYSLLNPELPTDMATGGLGLKAETANGLAAEFEYLLSYAPHELTAQQIRATASLAF
jgi:outer membrane autotransporter protein